MKKSWMIVLLVCVVLFAGSIQAALAAEAGKLKGSQTEKNLMTAFAGESQARNRYTYYAAAAKEEGLEQIAVIFLETADNEKEHAKIFFGLLKGGEVSISAAYHSHL